MIFKYKYILIIIGLFVVISTSILMIIGFKDESNVEYKDNIDDDNEDDIYRHVIKQWYNFPKHDKWFNNKEISMFDNRLLHEMNERWIIDTVNSNNNYSGLEMPEIYDPSMGQSQVIKQIFGYKKNGFFIECGAYDGETRSNTLNLERYYNWTGLLIEADPINFRKMIDKKRRAYLSPTCLSLKPYPMNTSFLMANNIGRIHQPNELTNKIENTKDVAHNGKHVDVQCFPLASYIMALNITSVDYFSLDVEGSEMEVLRTIPFSLVDIKTLSVEYTHVENGKNRMIKFMENNGYYSHTFVKKNYNLANDIIFVKR